MMENIQYPFVFMDESGTSDSKENPQPFFGVGFLKVNKPTEISKQLVNIQCCSISRSMQLKRNREFTEKLLNSNITKEELNLLLYNVKHSEFHFTRMKGNFLDDYMKFVDTLFQHSFHFCAIIINKLSMGERYKDYWTSYVKIAKLICQKNLNANERATIIADYMNKPNNATLSFEKTLCDLNVVNNAIRVQS